MLKMRMHLPLILLAITFLAAACNTATQPVISTETPVETVIESTPTLAPTESPTATPTVILEAALVLWAPESSDQVLAAQLEADLTAYANNNGQSFVRTPALSTAQIGQTVKVVVSTASPEEVQSLASVLPQVQFLAANAPSLTPTENLSVMVTGEASREQLSFLAGYALALGTTDYRVGVLSQAGTSEGGTARDAFVTGVRFHCGLCNARYVPVEYYPFTAEVTDPNNASDWQTAVDTLLAKSVTGIFVQPEITTPELIAYLNSKNITLIGIENQANLDSVQSLLGVLSSGLDLGPVLDQLLLGESVGTVHSGIELTRVNGDLFSDGRVILFERIKQDLLDGYIKALP